MTFHTQKSRKKSFSFLIMKTLLLLLACFSAVCSPAAQEEAVPRGRVLGELMNILNMPLASGKIFGDVDTDTPYAQELHSALSLGILDPSDDFSPEIACSNAEALMFALQTLGFRHEAEIARWALPPEDKRLPPYISGYTALAKALQPAAPSSIADNPRGSITEAQLQELLRWASQCSRKVLWDHSVTTPEGTLRLHRENAGRPPRGWRVQLGLFDSPEKARETAQKHALPDMPLSVGDVDFQYGVFTPLVKDRGLAFAMARKLDKLLGAVIQPDAGDSSALFWASFTPSSPSLVRIAFNQAHSPMVLGRLSDIAKASGAAAAVNGGYFSARGAIGAVIADSLPAVLPYGNRSMAAWDRKGNVFFGGGEFRARLSLDGGPYRPLQVNENVLFNGLGVVTPALGLSGKRAGNNGQVARVYGGLIQEARPALAWRRDMKPDEYLIISRRESAPLKAGSRARLQIQWRQDVPFAVSEAVQAGPLLYAPGLAPRDEGIAPSVTMMRHPRTLLGWDGKNMTWLVVDGRSSWHSTGLTLSEAAVLGRRMGFQALLNMDGGGSSELWWQGHVVNQVSDGRERLMPYALTVMKK